MFIYELSKFKPSKHPSNIVVELPAVDLPRVWIDKGCIDGNDMLEILDEYIMECDSFRDIILGAYKNDMPISEYIDLDEDVSPLKEYLRLSKKCAPTFFKEHIVSLVSSIQSEIILIDCALKRPDLISSNYKRGTLDDILYHNDIKIKVDYVKNVIYNILKCVHDCDKVNYDVSDLNF